MRVKLTQVAQLDEPIFVATRPGGASTIYIAQRGGQLRALRNGALVDQPVLDISSMISAGGERGFLGFAFSPDGTHLYVDYTDRDGNTNVDEYAVGADGGIDVSTYRQVLFQQQPYPNHNGGEVIFGPDGYLYIGLGDGGSEGDPQRHGHDLSTWLAKILRIDPGQSGDQPYTVPADNPFVGTAGAKPEIWSYGLRNPWRFSFDRHQGPVDRRRRAGQHRRGRPVDGGPRRRQGDQLRLERIRGQLAVQQRPERRQRRRAGVPVQPRRRQLLRHGRLRLPRGRHPGAAGRLRVRRLLRPGCGPSSSTPTATPATPSS